MCLIKKVKFLMDFQLNNAKAYFKEGLFTKFEIIPYENGWTLKIYFKDTNMSAGHIVDARGRKVRVLKSVDAAVALAKEVGFEIKGLTCC